MEMFVESLRRLYVSKLIKEGKILDLYKASKLTEEEKDYILFGK